MSTELAKAYVQIVPSASGIKGKLQEELGGEAEAAGKSSGSRFAGMLKNVIISAGIGTALKQALSAGADLEQSLGGIETLFKDSADTVIENAKNAYETAGMSANEYMETVTSFSASLLQSLGGDTQKAAESADTALRDMSDNANKMGTSMDLIPNAYQGFAKQNYTMLDNLKLGYGGTKTEMERLLADAQALTGVKYDINNLSDVYSAIHVIQNEMGITGATANEAATTFSGSLTSMKAAAQNVLGNLALGEDIGPSLTALSETVFTFAGNLIPMVGNILSSLPEVLDSALGMAIQGLNLAADNADVIVQNGVDLLSSLVTGIVSALPYLAEAAVNIVVALGEALLNTDWIGVATDIITGLQQSLGTASQEIFGTDTTLIDGVLNTITTNLPNLMAKGNEMVLNLVLGIANTLPDLITTAGGLLSTFVGFIMDNLPTILEAGVELLLSLVDGIIQSLPNIVSAAISAVGSLLSTILEKAPSLIEGGLTLIGKLLAGLIQAIPKLIGKIPEIISNIKKTFTSFDWKGIGSNIISGIANGLANGLSKVVEAAKDVAKKAFDAAKEFLDINSPSGAFEWIGEESDEGLAVGLVGNTGLIKKAMKSVVDTMTSSYNPELSVKPLIDYTVTQPRGTVEKNETGNFSEKLDQIIYLLELLATKDVKMFFKDREVARALKDLGVSFA